MNLTKLQTTMARLSDEAEVNELVEGSCDALTLAKRVISGLANL